MRDLLKREKTPGFFGKDDEPGKTTGWVEILEADTFEQTDLETGDVIEWSPGRPKMGISMKLDIDDGVMVYFTGQKFTALSEAVSEAEIEEPEPGMWVKVTYDGESDRKPKKAHHNRAKLFSVELSETKPAGAKKSTAKKSTAKKATKAVERPDSISEKTWAKMDEDERAEMLATLGDGPA